MRIFRKEVIQIAKKKTLEELRSQQEKLEQDLKVKTQNLKSLQMQAKELERKQRTHRLCTHGAMLEQYFNPEEFTDEQMDRILRVLFRRTDTMQLLESVKHQTDMQDWTQ